MEAILHQVQRIFIRHFFTKQFIYQGIKGSDKEEVVFTFFRDLLEGVFQSAF